MSWEDGRLAKVRRGRLGSAGGQANVTSRMGIFCAGDFTGREARELVSTRMGLIIHWLETTSYKLLSHQHLDQRPRESLTDQPIKDNSNFSCPSQ